MDEENTIPFSAGGSITSGQTQLLNEIILTAPKSRSLGDISVPSVPRIGNSFQTPSLGNTSIGYTAPSFNGITSGAGNLATSGGGSLDVTPSYSFEEKAQLVGQGVGGLGGIAMGIIGSGARKKEQKAATAAYEQSLADYKNFQFENAYADIENPFEDLRVSTEAAEFQAQQQEQNLAKTLDALRSSGGGAGAASVAQALAQSQARQTQQIAADMAMDEAANEAARAGFQGKLNILEAEGAEGLEQKEYGRTFTTLGMDQQRKAAADLARQQATASIVGGIADVVAPAASIAMGNPMGALKALGV
jgi:hypothetical protein